MDSRHHILFHNAHESNLHARRTASFFPPTVNAPAPLPRKLMVGVALCQGLALLYLLRAQEHGFWPSQEPLFNYPLWTLALAWPFLLLMTLVRDNLAAACKLVSAVAVVPAALAVYVGQQARPVGAFPVSELRFMSAVTLLAACFVILPYLQQRLARGTSGDGALFCYAWRNGMVVALAEFLMVGVGLILALWGTLFSAIGIDFFQELFRQDWFLVPVLAGFFGLGIHASRRQAGVVDDLVRLFEGLAHLLLPLATSAMALFLAALPFTGLELLWETGAGTASLVWLNILILLFINLVYQGKRSHSYPVIVHRLLYGGIALLPMIAALAGYGLYLRVAQYGWTVSRCWAMAIIVTLALCSCLYSWSILRRRDSWPQGLGRANALAGWLVLALALLTNSPLLDFRKVAVNSQAARLEAGEDLDVRYLGTRLARPGYLALQSLAEEYRETDPQLVQRIREQVAQTQETTAEQQPADPWDKMRYWPAPFEVPPGVRQAIDDGRQLASYPGEFTLLRLDLNQDQAPEYVLIAHHSTGRNLHGWCYSRDGGGWREYLVEPRRRDAGKPFDLAQALQEGAESVAPPFQDLKIGDQVLAITRNLSPPREPPEQE